MSPEDLKDETRNKLDPDRFKEELSDDILNDDAGEILEGKEETGIDDDLDI